jgi:hypothetical protein
MHNPQQYFNMGKDTPIRLVNMSKDQKHAKEVWFEEFKAVLRRVKAPGSDTNWFADHGVDIRDEKDIQTRKVEFTKNIKAFSLDSQHHTAEGVGVLVAIFDEIADFPFQKAKQLYDNVEATATSRYAEHYRLILLSYPRHENDFMMTRWGEAEEAADPDVYQSKHCTWEVNPFKKREHFNKLYEKNPEEARRRFECEVDARIEGYYKYPERIKQCINRLRHCPVIEAEEYTYRELSELNFHEWFRGGMVEELHVLQKRIDAEGGDESKLSEEERKRWHLLRARHESAVYTIHLDLAKGKEDGDAIGFAMGHAYPVSPNDEAETTEYGVYVDLAMQIRAPVQGGEVRFADLRDLILRLRDDRNFNIVAVTFDGYQSHDSIQILNEHDIEAKEQSVDRTTGPHDTLKSLIYQHYLDMYHYAVPIRELEELRRDEKTGKIDHPAHSRRRQKEEGKNDGSKDVADGLAGMVTTALTEGDRSVDFVPL